MSVYMSLDLWAAKWELTELEWKQELNSVLVPLNSWHVGVNAPMKNELSMVLKPPPKWPEQTRSLTQTSVQPHRGTLVWLENFFFFFLIRPTQVRSPSGESFTTWSSWLTSLTLCNTRFYWCLETPMGIFNHVRIHRNYMHRLHPSQMIL